MLSPIIDNWEKYEELNAKLAKVLEEQEKHPTASGYDAICGMCKELETLNKIHKKKVELMEDFEDENEDAIIETMLSAYQDKLDEINKEAKKKMSFDWLEVDKDGFMKVCNNFKIPETPEFKPYIP
jgi:hypothetical protein